MSGWNPPPAPGYGPQPPFSPGPPPGAYGPPRRSGGGAGLVIGLLAGGLVLVVVIVVAVVVLVNLGGKHTIETPPSAGGMVRNSSLESRYASEISRQRSVFGRADDYRVKETKSAVYSRGSDSYLFYGGTGDLDPDDLYSDFSQAMRRQSSSSVSVLTTPTTAGGDGKAVCTSIRSRVTNSLRTRTSQTAVCAWMTKSSFGILTPLTTGSTLNSTRYYGTATVGLAMRRLRSGVES